MEALLQSQLIPSPLQVALVDHMLDIQIRSQAPIDFEVTDLQFEPSASVEVSKRLRHHMHALDESHPDPAPYTCAVCVRRGRSGAW